MGFRFNRITTSLAFAPAAFGACSRPVPEITPRSGQVEWSARGAQGDVPGSVPETMEISAPAALTANRERIRLGLLTVNLGQREVHTQIAMP